MILVIDTDYSISQIRYPSSTDWELSEAGLIDMIEFCEIERRFINIETQEPISVRETRSPDRKPSQRQLPFEA